MGPKLSQQEHVLLCYQEKQVPWFHAHANDGIRPNPALPVRSLSLPLPGPQHPWTMTFWVWSLSPSGSVLRLQESRQRLQGLRLPVGLSVYVTMAALQILLLRVNRSNPNSKYTALCTTALARAGLLCSCGDNAVPTIPAATRSAHSLGCGMELGNKPLQRGSLDPQKVHARVFTWGKSEHPRNSLAPPRQLRTARCGHLECKTRVPRACSSFPLGSGIKHD